MRLLNPCNETDYDEQIFENPDSHELVGNTEIASFHIDILDLNNPALVNARKERAVLYKLLRSPIILSPNAPVLDSSMPRVIEQFRILLKSKIPPIKPPPATKNLKVQTPT